MRSKSHKLQPINTEQHTLIVNRIQGNLLTLNMGVSSTGSVEAEPVTERDATKAKKGRPFQS